MNRIPDPQLTTLEALAATTAIRCMLRLLERYGGELETLPENTTGRELLKLKRALIAAYDKLKAKL